MQWSVCMCLVLKKKIITLQTIKIAKMYVLTEVFQNILQYKRIKTANQHTVAVDVIVIIFT